MKFFVDNNISPKAARALNCLVEPHHSVVHLKDKFAAETPDIEWMEKLAEEPGWIIVSGDTNISRNPHEINAWKTAGHTIFFLTHGWIHLGRFEQASKLLAIFPRIIELAEKAKRSSAFMVPVRGAKIEKLVD